MDIDENGRVTEDEFLVYWKNYAEENYGYYDESYDKFYKKAFYNITEGKDYFDWPMYKKFLTEVKIETEKDDGKLMF